MKQLTELIAGLDYDCVQGNIEGMVSKVIYDSRKVEKDCLFICIEGAKCDGHDFAAEAVRQGARALVVSKDVMIPDTQEVTVIRVENTRYAMAFISAAYFEHPAKKMNIIGITGTKGKTTTTYLVKSVLEQSGHRVGLVGTIEIIIGDLHIPADNTTPESYLLQEYFRKMVDAGCDTVVMEVSSQGLMLHRTQGFEFDYGILTNIEPDHIGKDEHESFEEYMACKGLLFRQCKIGIVNMDDTHTATVIEGHTCKLETFGFSESADLRASNVELISSQGKLCVAFQITGLLDFHVTVATPGRFSVYNALTAIAICRHFVIPVDTMKQALLQAQVKGRIEMVSVSDQFTVMIDYAHNAMSLESLLSTLREYKPARLVCLFGCGGNRSKYRRYEMGEISGKLADVTIITSDNPRSEEPMDIIKDIETGIQKTNGAYHCIADRREAIAYAIHQGKPGDIIVLAGKGHEDYQEIKGIKYPMDERIIIRDILAADRIKEQQSGK